MKKFKRPKNPEIVNAAELARDWPAQGHFTRPVGRTGWVVLRPVPFFGIGHITYRLHAAWGVLTGRYDAIWWPGQ